MQTDIAPVHPGTVIVEMYLKPHNISVAETASAIGVDNALLLNIIDGNSPVTIQLSLKLAKAFDTSPEFWLSLQQKHDLFFARKTTHLTSIKSIVKKAVAL